MMMTENGGRCRLAAFGIVLPKEARFGREGGRKGIREAGTTRRAFFQGFTVKYGAAERDREVVEKDMEMVVEGKLRCMKFEHALRTLSMSRPI